MSTPSDPQDGTDRPAGTAGADQPAYYRPGPSSGYYPQYPQNPYGPGRAGGPPPQFSGTGAAQYGTPPQLGGYEGATYPYGGPYPAPGSVGAVSGATPVDTTHRPRNVAVGFGLLLVPPAIFLFFGLALALAPLSADMFPPEAGVDAMLTQAGLTMTQFLAALRPLGVVMAVLAAVYAVLAVVSFLGKLGALITLTVLTALFDLVWLVGLLSAASNPGGAILPLIVLGTSVAGLWLMFTPPARAWFAARR